MCVLIHRSTYNISPHPDLYAWCQTGPWHRLPECRSSANDVAYVYVRVAISAHACLYLEILAQLVKIFCTFCPMLWYIFCTFCTMSASSSSSIKPYHAPKNAAVNIEPKAIQSLAAARGTKTNTLAILKSLSSHGLLKDIIIGEENERDLEKKSPMLQHCIRRHTRHMAHLYNSWSLGSLDAGTLST